MITAEKYIKKGTQLLYFPQPEISPIKLRVAKSKKKGEEAVRCYEVGKNKTKTRLYTIEKLKNMKGYDNYKLESPPEIGTKTHQVNTFKESFGNQWVKFELAFEQTSDNEIISVYRNSFEITKIWLGNKEECSESETNFSSVMINIFSQDSLLENLNEYIEARFSSNCTEIIED